MAISQALRDLKLLWRWRVASEPLKKEELGLTRLARLRDRIYPSYMLGDFSKTWSDGSDRSVFAERRFLLSEFAMAVAHLPGETAEAGVYNGTSSRIICTALGRRHHAFDSFEGISQPDPVDGGFWHAGDFAISEQQARTVLKPFGASVYRGWIPEVFGQARIERLCLAHVDVDLYQPTRESLVFFYPRLVPGGVLICDDYGFATCPGARAAVDDFMADKPEPVIHLPTGQGLVLKHSTEAP